MHLILLQLIEPEKNLRSLPNLCDSSIRSLQTRLDSLRGLISKLDGGLEKSYWEFRMNFSCNPQTELLVHILSACDLKTENNTFLY